MKVLPFLIPKSTTQSIHLQVDKQPYLYDYLHQHAEIQISLILKGEGQLIIGEYLGRFGPGDIYIIGSNIPHVFKNDPEYYQGNPALSAHAVSVYFTWKTFGDVFWNLPELRPIGDKQLMLSHGLKIKAVHQDQLQHMILNLWQEEGLHRLFKLMQLLETILDQSRFSYLTKPDEVMLSQSQGVRLNSIYQFTMANYPRQISLEEVAQIAFLSVTSFCRYFKKSTRKSYFEFLNEVRIGHACRLLLKQKDQPVYQIAYAVGFKNIANFNRQFKKIIGSTPSGYRKKIEGA